MAAERPLHKNDIGNLARGLNTNARPPSELIVPYSKISDEKLRISLRTGELIIEAADNKGVQLLPAGAGAGENVDWFSFRIETVMSSLSNNDVRTVREVLEEARKQANSRFNGDRDKVLDSISRLLKTVGGDGHFTPPENSIGQTTGKIKASGTWKPRESDLPRGPGSHSGENKQKRWQSRHNGRGRTNGNHSN